MLKYLIAILTVLILGVGGFWVYKNLLVTQQVPISIEKKTITKEATSTATKSSEIKNACQVLEKGSLDVPPLDSIIQWQKPTVTNFEVPLSVESQQLNGCLIISDRINLETTYKVRDNYSRELKTRNWNLESAGDMPGAGFITWKKKTSYLLLKFDPINYDANLKTITLFYTQ